MVNRLLINCENQEELRAAVVSNNQLQYLEVESVKNLSKKGNVYKAKVLRIERSLQAAFLDLGLNRNGFLQIQELNLAVLSFCRGEKNFKRQPLNRKARIEQLLEVGEEILVQVVKDETESKGAMLTMNLAIPSRYTVLLVGGTRVGVSKRIRDFELNARLKAILEELSFDQNKFGLIVRPSSQNRSSTDIARDIKICLSKWEKIEKAFGETQAPALIYAEESFSTRVVREYFSAEIQEIIVDTLASFNEVREFVEETMPRYKSRVHLYKNDIPIFSFYEIEDEVAKTYDPIVYLPSGGFVVIEPLESLVAIDVNSGKAKSGQDFEQNAFKTNIEAVEEIARQLRLRDLGGLIIIDLIDMKNPRNIKEVERRMKLAVEKDRARVEVGEISRFGLLELSRQRIRTSINSQTFDKCAYCGGTGKIRGPELVALDVLRKVQQAAATNKVEQITVYTSFPAALYLLNFRKKQLSSIEQKYSVSITVLPQERFRLDEFELQFVDRKVPTSMPETSADLSFYDRVKIIRARWRAAQPVAKVS